MNNGHPEAAPRSRQHGVHPTEKTLRRFALGTTSRAENRAIVAHLLGRCGQCSRMLAKAGEELLQILRRRAGEKAS